jgi:hypothetical protein
MAVKPVEPNQGGPSISGHPQAVADRCAGMAHQHAVGAWPDILAEQLRIAWEPAIGDDNRSGADIHRLAVLVCGHSDNLTALQAQRRRSGGKKKPALLLLEASL